ncbi:MAG: hypothetical protein JKY89_06215 [Immundisolibacteraceae bacterium]|nr:hypothetical protein [Immundisolibacteraceae bacterium]
MSKVYVVKEDATTEAMTVVHCSDEEAELQRILELNPDLIPGDQIRPEDPRRWLVVKREMPVPDPASGGNRWSIDFLFVDQDGVPTFIECKRYSDTRARREVVGQMLEYAANGHYYWSKEQMRTYAESTAEQKGTSLESEIRRLRPDGSENIDEFFQCIEDNLREGQVRLVFFLEQSPPELKSVVDFLNRQMERSEVLLVEARQYEHAGLKIVSPILFGYTEQARQVKRIVSVSSGKRRKWDKQSFFGQVAERLTKEQTVAVGKMLEESQNLLGRVSWGTGNVNGSFSVGWSHFGTRSIFTIDSNGKLTVSYGHYDGLPQDRDFRPFLGKQLADKLGLSSPDGFDNKYLGYSIDQWSAKASGLRAVLELLLERYPEPEIPQE